MQADSASLFGFRKQALWKDKRQTHGMDFRLVRSVTAISIQFLTVPQPAGRHYLLLRVDPGRNVWGKARGNITVLAMCLRLAICAATFWFKPTSNRFEVSLSLL